MNREGKNSKRGERLAAERRKKAKVRKYLKEEWYGGEEFAKDPGFVGKLAQAPHPCSGRCCGNPRCHCKGRERLTFQELRQLESEESED